MFRIKERKECILHGLFVFHSLPLLFLGKLAWATHLLESCNPESTWKARASLFPKVLRGFRAQLGCVLAHYRQTWASLCLYRNLDRFVKGILPFINGLPVFAPGWNILKRSIFSFLSFPSLPRVSLPLFAKRSYGALLLFTEKFIKVSITHRRSIRSADLGRAPRYSGHCRGHEQNVCLLKIAPNRFRLFTGQTIVFVNGVRREQRNVYARSRA